MPSTRPAVDSGAPPPRHDRWLALLERLAPMLVAAILVAALVVWLLMRLA